LNQFNRPFNPLLTTFSTSLWIQKDSYYRDVYFFISLAAAVLFILLGCSVTKAQSLDTLKAYQDLDQGLTYHKEKNFDSAYVYLLRAANQYQAAGLEERYAFTQLRCAFSAHRGRKYYLAERHYKQSLETYESLYPADNLKIAASCMGLGSLYAVTGNYYQALIHTNRSLAVKVDSLGADHIDTGVNYYNSGTAHMNYGEYENAMDAYQKALPVYLKHHGEEHQRVSSLYVNMGILYDKRGESEKALEYYLRSVEIDRKLYGDDFYLLAYNYYNMAISYVNLHRNELAETYYHKTIALSDANQLYQLLATAHYGLGNIEAEKEHYEEAIALYQQSIDLFLKHFGNDFPGMNHSYRAMAKALAQQGAYQRSIEYLQQTLNLLARNFGSHHPFTGATYQQLASVHLKQHQFEAALEAIKRGYSALLKESIVKEQAHSPDAYSDQQVLLDLVREEARILETKYHVSDDLADLELALSTLRRAIDFIDQIRKGFILDDSKLLLQEEATATFEQAISASFKLHVQTGEDKYLDDMFEFMEKSKATLLAETLQSNALSNIQGIPDSVLVEESRIKRKISFVESQLTGTDINIDSIQNELFILRRRYDTLAEHIAETYPKYYQLKYQVDTKKLDDVKLMLAPSQAVLTYFLGHDYWYVLAIAQNGINAIQIDSANIKESDVIKFREMLADAQYPWDNQLANRLFSNLVADPLEGLGQFDRLIVVPDGLLGHISFDALTLNPSDKPIFAVTEYAISYTPSVTMLGLSETYQQASNSYYGFAPVHYQDELSSLLGSQQEVNMAADLYNGKSYLYQQATEANLKEIESCGVIHLAMHALIDDQDPMRSRLIFANSTDSMEDGDLYANEIYNLKLNSKLSILSACNTGYGNIARGEGIMNLSRAFQYAGSPNILMTLWQASDASTSDIVFQFLRNIKDGKPKDLALQQAKLSYLDQADPLQAHPAFWATFVFMGDAAPIDFGNPLWKWLVPIVLTMALVVWFRGSKFAKTLQAQGK
jgi:CHAT domain-containing protein